METIQLQTPWKRGDNRPCTSPGEYLMRKGGESAKWLGVKTTGQIMCPDHEYIGPLDIQAPEPMPELVQIPNSHNQPSCTQGDLITDDVHLWVCRWQNGYREVIEIQMADERTARLAFNAAARVLNESR